MKKVASLSISISDTSISTALVLRCKEKKNEPACRPKIVSYRSDKFNPEHKDVTLDYLETRLKILLRKILQETRYEDAVKAGITVRHIEHVFISLSAPWFEGRSAISHFHEAKEFKVTKSLLENAFDTEIKGISGKGNADIAVLESSILSATVNGYSVTEPIGKIGTSLSITGYVSYMKNSTKAIILETLDSFFHNAHEIVIKSEPLVLLFAALRESEIKQLGSEFAIIRVNELVTHIQIIRDGHIREIGTIPYGLNDILLKISSAFSSTLEASSDVLNLFLRKELEKHNVEKLEEILREAFGEWRSGIKKFSSEIITSGKFPSHVFLSSPSAASNLFRDHLLNDDYLDLTMSERELTVDVLDRSTLDEFIDTDKSIIDAHNTPGFLTKLIALM
jgi:cell division ATPase FtsA